MRPNSIPSRARFCPDNRRYLDCKQRISGPVNDRIGVEPYLVRSSSTPCRPGCEGGGPPISLRASRIDPPRAGVFTSVRPLDEKWALRPLGRGRQAGRPILRRGGFHGPDPAHTLPAPLPVNRRATTRGDIRRWSDGGGTSTSRLLVNMAWRNAPTDLSTGVIRPFPSMAPFSGAAAGSQ